MIMVKPLIHDPEFLAAPSVPATEADLDLICRWHVEFNAEATGHPIEYSASYEKNSKRLSDFYLFEDSSGQVVAMACIARKLLKGCCVSLVYTDPAQRGKATVLRSCTIWPRCSWQPVTST
jgi:hypothetical protein